MMMETVVYSREFLFVKQLYESGKLGRMQFLRGASAGDGRLARLLGRAAADALRHALRQSVLRELTEQPGRMCLCHGSGRISDKLTAKYGSPFAVETATIRMADSPLCCEVTRSLFETARQYIESFDVYGDKATFEWTRIEHEPCVVHHGEKPERVTVPDFAHLLPEGIRRYTTKGVYDADEAQHLSFTQGSGHGGSHPHMATSSLAPSSKTARRVPTPARAPIGR